MLLALTKGIARGFAADNILAYAVAPGWVGTGIGNHVAEDLEPQCQTQNVLPVSTPSTERTKARATSAAGTCGKPGKNEW